MPFNKNPVHGKKKTPCCKTASTKHLGKTNLEKTVSIKINHVKILGDPGLIEYKVCKKWFKNKLAKVSKVPKVYCELQN